MAGVVLVTLACAVFAFVLGRRSRLFSNGQSFLLVAAAAAVGAAGGMMFWHYHCEVWNSARTMVPYAVARGIEIYNPAGTGPAWANIYPPVGFWLYTPVSLGGTPDAAVYIGQVLSVALVSGSLYLAARLLTGTHTAPLLTLGVWYACAALIQPLSDVTFSVHVDAPALAFLLLACALVTFPSARFVVLAGVLAAMSVGSKQTTLPGVLVLAGWLWYRQGWGTALRYVGGFVVCGLVLTGLALVNFSPAGLYHVIVTVPTSQQLDFGQSYSIAPFVPRLLAWIPGPIVAGVVLCRVARFTPAVPMLLVGAAQIPPALAARFKVGGDENNLAFFLLFFVVAGAVSLHQLLTTLSVTTRARAVTALLLLVALAGVVSVRRYGGYRSWSGQAGVNPHDVSYTLLKAHPGRYYFQWLPLSHYLGEGRLTHQSWGLADRGFAGEKITPEWLSKYSPPDAAFLCSLNSPLQGDLVFTLLSPAYSVRVSLPELPGWWCYVKPRSPTLSPGPGE